MLVKLANQRASFVNQSTTHSRETTMYLIMDRLDKLVGRLQWGGLLPSDAPSLGSLANTADQLLLGHHQSKPCLVKTSPQLNLADLHSMRPWVLEFNLLQRNDQNFIPLCLFKDI